MTGPNAVVLYTSLRHLFVSILGWFNGGSLTDEDTARATTSAATWHFGVHPRAQPGSIAVFIEFGQIAEHLFEDETREPSQPPVTYR